MIYSVACEYSIRALTKLAHQAPAGRYCLLRDIVDGAKLPQHFVGKIFQTLVRERILTSAKGRGGGFALRRPPGEITLRQIVDVIDGPKRIESCFLGFDACDERNPCPAHSRCAQMRGMVEEFLDEITLEELVKVMRQREGRRKARRR